MNIDALALLAFAAWIAWACYRAGWARRGEHDREQAKADRTKWEELAAIAVAQTESDLAIHDLATGQDAQGRKRRMTADELDENRQRALRAGIVSPSG